METFPVSAELWALGEAVFEYGFESLAQENGTLQPAVLTEDASGNRTLSQLVVLSPDTDLLAAASSSVSEMRDADRAAIVLDGHTHIGGATEDALLVYVQERGTGHSHQFAQRYRRTGIRKRIEPVGNLGYVGESQSLFDVEPLPSPGIDAPEQ